MFDTIYEWMASLQLEMNLLVTGGTGAGPTKLAAFDAALLNAGVANFNLIGLSSIIPEGAVVREMLPNEKPIPGRWGDRLYVVMAQQRVDTPNAEAWAGIGWAQDKKTGQGMFVEHQGPNEKSVRKDIKATLRALFSARKMKIGRVHMEVHGTVCTAEPVCAIAVAVFEPESWAGNSRS